MSCAVCHNPIGEMLEIDSHVRNVTSQPFELLGRTAHPKCLGLHLCPGCKKHWVMTPPCRHSIAGSIPVTEKVSVAFHQP